MLCYKNAVDAIEVYKNTYGATEIFRMDIKNPVNNWWMPFDTSADSG